MASADRQWVRLIVSDDETALVRELRLRLQEIEVLSLEVRHLQADLQVKDEYIAVLQREAPQTPAEVQSARRYLAVRMRIRGALQRYPIVWRAAHAVVTRLRRNRRMA